MAIRFSNEDIKYTLKQKRKIVHWINEIAKSYHKTAGEISIIFVSDSYILKINNQYLHHDYFTDIITFDYSNEDIIEGDIFISVDTVLSNSKKFNSAFNDEILRVIIHGILHLVGFKDKKPKEKDEMTRNEDLALALFLKTNDK